MNESLICSAFKMQNYGETLAQGGQIGCQERRNHVTTADVA